MQHQWSLGWYNINISNTLKERLKFQKYYLQSVIFFIAVKVTMIEQTNSYKANKEQTYLTKYKYVVLNCILICISESGTSFYNYF